MNTQPKSEKMDDQTVTIEAPPQNGAEAVPASYADSVVADLAAVRARALSAIEHYEEQARGETERHNRRIAEINGHLSLIRAAVAALPATTEPAATSDETPEKRICAWLTDHGPSARETAIAKALGIHHATVRWVAIWSPRLERAKDLNGRYVARLRGA